MITIKSGNILNTTEDIICQQVNCQGVMGSGLALQIKNRYPEVYVAYKECCNQYSPKQLLGKTQTVKCDDGKYVANLFGQLNYGTKNKQTDYKALKTALDSVFNSITNIDKYKGLSVAIPYGIGCGLGGGDWETVYSFIRELCGYYKCDTVIYKQTKC